MTKPHTQFCGLRLCFHTLLYSPEKHEDWQKSYTGGGIFLGASPLWRKVKCSKLCCVLDVQKKTTFEEIFTTLLNKKYCIILCHSKLDFMISTEGKD
jgi:hypothetical protein